ncbi:MAG: TIGR03792 family protein [Synechococcus sp.]
MGNWRRTLWAIAMTLLLWSIGVVGGFDMAAVYSANQMPSTAVVEWLEFNVPVTEQEEFLRRDEKIWTSALREQPGFLHKSVWRSPKQPESVVLVIYWASREDWHAFPEPLIEELDRQMQPTNAVLVDAKEFSVNPPVPLLLLPNRQN